MSRSDNDACAPHDVSVMRACYAAVRTSLENASLENPTYGSTRIALPDGRDEDFTLWSFMTHVEWSKSMRRCTKTLRKTSKPSVPQTCAFLPPPLTQDSVRDVLSNIAEDAPLA